MTVGRGDELDDTVPSVASADTQASGEVIAAPSAAPGTPSAETVMSIGGDVASAETMMSAGEGDVAARTAALPVVDTAAYVRIDEFARGGLGRIIRAKDQRTGRTVAIKEMLATSEDAAARFVREAMVTANLQHPAIVPVYEVGRWPSGQPFYAMKLVVGRPMNEVIDACTNTDARLAMVPHVIAVADALAYAHGERVIHRDLKPHNVLVGAHGETVVIDWGLARRIDDDEHSIIPAGEVVASPGATIVGAVMGTPGYMAPEQARGERVDVRADVYAIGAILYHALTGKPPYAGRSIEDLLERVRSGPPAPIARIAPAVPADLAAIVERAMARDPADRYPTAAELVSDLRRFSEGQLVAAHRYTRRQRLARFVRRYRAAVAIGALAVVVLGIGIGVSLSRIARERDKAAASRDTAEARLVDAYVAVARIELAAERPDRALPYAAAVGRLRGLDPPLRFIAGRALDAVPGVHRTASDKVLGVVYAPGSHDLVVASQTQGIRRLSATGTAWQLPGQAGMLVPYQGDMLACVTAPALLFVTASTGEVFTTMASPFKLTGFLGSDRDQHWFAASSLGGIELFDAVRRAHVATIPVSNLVTPPIVSLDGARFVAATEPKSLHYRIDLYDRTGASIAMLCDDCKAFDADGEQIVFVVAATATAPAQLVRADWAGARLGSVGIGTGVPLSLALDFVHDQLALTTEEGSLEVYRAHTLETRWRTQIDDHGVALHFDHSGRLWVLGPYLGVQLFHSDTGAPLAHWPLATIYLAVSDDDRHAAAASISEVMSWAVPDTLGRVLAPTTARVRRMIELPDGRWVSGSEDGTIASYDRDGTARRFARHDGRISDLAALADGSVLSSSADGTTVIWDVLTGQALQRFDAGLHAAATPDGQTIAIGDHAGEVTLRDRATRTRRVLLQFPSPISAIHWSADGAMLGAVDEDGALVVWRRDGTMVRRIPLAPPGLDFAFSHDGKWLARTGEEPLTLYALTADHVDRALEAGKNFGTTNMVYAVAFSPDDHALVGGASGALEVWDTTSGAFQAQVSVRTDVLTTEFSPDGRLIYGGSTDHRLRVWDARTGAELSSYRTTYEIYDVVVARDGAHVAASTLGPAVLWSTTSFAGDAAQLDRLARCRSTQVVEAGVVKTNTIDVAACNRDAPP